MAGVIFSLTVYCGQGGSPTVTHASVLAPHYALTRKKMAEHDGFARTLPSLGSWTLPVAAAKITKTVKTKVAGKRVSKSVTTDRKSRDAVLHVSAAQILVCAPKVRRGQHGKIPLPMWVVRVWEPHLRKASNPWNGSC